MMTILMAVTMLAASTLAISPSPEPVEPKVSVFFYVLTDTAKEEGVSLKAAADLLVQAGVTGFDCEFCDPRIPEYLATGLKPVNFYGHMKFLDSDGGRALAEEFVDKAVKCGCGHIMILPDDFTDGKPNEPEFEKIIEGFRYIASLARSKGIVPTVEPFGNWRNACSYFKYLKRIMAAVPELALALDTGNFHYVGRGDDIVELAEFANTRIAHVHLKDWKKGVKPLEPNGRRNYETLGRGAVPNERLVRYAKELGYNGWWTLERPLKGTTLSDVRRQIGVLKNWYFAGPVPEK